MTGRPVVIAVDGGQSSTKCLVGDLDGRQLGWASGGPIWHIDEPGGHERVRSAIVDAVTGALANARSSVEDVRSAYLSLTGSADAAREIATQLLPRSDVIVESDTMAALASGTYGGPGLVVIAGTGSVALALDADGRRTYRGGWGPTLGDEGSGHWIGLRALNAVTQAVDGRGESTALVEAICGHLQVAKPRDLFDLVYSANLDRAGIAALARLVASTAEAGDQVATSIIDRAIEALTLLVIATAEASDLDGDARRIVLSGGLLLGNEAIAGDLSDALSRKCPGYLIVRPTVPPIVGAYALALNSLGLDAQTLLRPHTYEGN